MTEVRVCPDSGATTDLISENTAKKIGMNILPNKDNWKVVDAEGKPVKISGVGKVDLARPRGRWKTYTLIVCPKISDAMLLSWATQKSLGILPAGWPWEDYSGKGTARRMSVKNTDMRIRKITATDIWPPPEWPRRLRDLCEEYSDVLVDEL